MRRFLLLVAVLALAAPAQAAEFRFQDVQDDVETKDADAGSLPGIDILDAGLREDGRALSFWMSMAGLEDLPSLSVGPDRHYRLDFVTRADHAGYSLRASYAGVEAVSGTSVPLRSWSFAVQDRQTDGWTAAVGEVADGRITWTIEPGRVDLGDGVAAVWDAIAWLGNGAPSPAMDYTVTADGFRRGAGAVQGPFEEVETLEATYARLGAWTAFTDEVGDVHGGEGGIGPYDGPGSRGADVLAARVADAGEALVLELQLDELDSVEAEHEEPGFHAQYAFCFTPPQAGEQCMRATYRGAGMGSDGWGFKRHDTVTDEWPEADGFVSGDSLVWTVPKVELGLVDGDLLDGWHVSTWNSYDDRDQHGDRAGAAPGDAFVIGATAPQIARSLPPPPPLPPLDCPSTTDHGISVLVDRRGDTDMRGQPYDGAGAGMVDALEAWAAVQGDALTVTLQARDLADAVHPGDEGTSVQWALGIVHGGVNRYDLRATYGVGDYWAPGWSFNIHDRELDAWPDVEGLVQDDAIVWHVDLADVGLAPGDTIDGWGLSVWSSGRPDREQIGDRGQGSTPVAVSPTSGGCALPDEGPGAGWGRVGVGAARDVEQPQEVERGRPDARRNTPGIGVPIYGGLFLLAVLGRRR